MGIYKVVLPKMGESVSEATLTKWVKAIGDTVEEDDPIVEIATDKVDSDVPAPVRGTLSKIFFEENQTVQVGEVLAWIEVEGGASEEEPAEAQASETIEQPLPTTENDEQPEEAIPGTEWLNREPSPKTVLHSGVRFYSPLVNLPSAAVPWMASISA